MQVQDMITRVRWEIGEPAVAGQMGVQAGTWSDPQILDYLNDCQQLLAKPARLQADPLTVALVNGTDNYVLPADCLEDGMRRVLWVTANGTYLVEDVGLDRWTQLNADAQPNNNLLPTTGMAYAQWASKIWLYPTPTNSTDRLTVYYYKYPPALVNVTDVPLIPPRFDPAMIKFAVAQCQAAVEESQLQMIAMQEFERLSAQLTAERSIENRDRPGRVRLR